MVVCAIYGCSENHRGTRTFFRFPRNKVYQDIWINCCERKSKINIRSARVCCRHFTESDFKENGIKSRKVLKVDATPSLYLPSQVSVKGKSSIANRVVT